MRTAYLVGAARTPIGAFNGGLRDLSAAKLGSIAIRAALERAKLQPSQVDEVLMGCVLEAGAGQGPGRQASIGAGIPESVPGWSLNQLCGSGLKTVCLASQMIGTGDAECVVAGGMESMSQSSYVLPWARTGQRMGHAQAIDTMIWDGLTDVFSGEHMGITAEAVAEKFEISRQAQDAFAAESQRRTAAAIQEGAFATEIVPVTIPIKKGDPLVVKADEHPKPDTSAEKLAKLRPAFKEGGSVTAGNSSGINDGAAAVVVASEDFVKKHGLTPLARVAGHATTGCSPRLMGLGPIEASRRALARAGWKLSDIERAELNEAFAAQSIAVARELGIDAAITNPLGGAIALGHPIGASGARILVTLVHELARTKARRGLAALCVGGGMGTAMVVERV